MKLGWEGSEEQGSWLLVGKHKQLEKSYPRDLGRRRWGRTWDGDK